MKELSVLVVCDRCKKQVDGLEMEAGTSGFYRGEGYWGRYMDEGEKIVCDACMAKDERYQADYLAHTNEGRLIWNRE